MRSKWLAPIIIVLMVLFTLVIYSQLPEQLPIHWDFNGQVNQTAARPIGAFMAPVIAIFVLGLMRIVPLIDPRRAVYERFAGAYETLINLLVVFFGVLHVVTLGSAIGWNIPVPQVVMVGVGILVAFLGNQMARIQPNWFVGIRTPWTLSDEEVWKQTHRFGARMFFVSGLLAAIIGIILPMPFVTIPFFLIILGGTLAPVLYSYIVWQRLHRNSLNGQS